MADLMAQLVSKMGGKVADARKRDAQGVASGIAVPQCQVARRVARAAGPALGALLTAALAGAACSGGAAPALPDPGQNGVAFTVKSEPPGATVVVDGVAVGAAPVALKLRPGPHRMHATLSGYYPAPEARVQVGAAEPPEVTIHLIASH